MPRSKETYAAEYAARTARAQAAGWSGYGQLRGTSEAITKVFRDAKAEGEWPLPIPKPGDRLFDDLLDAKRILLKVPEKEWKKQRKLPRAERGVLSKGSEEARDILRKLRKDLGWQKEYGKTPLVYFRALRILYGKRQRGR